MAYKDERHLASLREGSLCSDDRFDPLLVCLHDSAKDYRASKDKASFEHLVHSVISILDANLSKSEKILTADVLITLIRQAEKDLRSNLSERLAVRDDLPDSLLHYLAYGEIDIAEAVLLYSPILQETDLLYVIQAKGEDHWQAIARRADIPKSVCESLAEKDSTQTHLNLLWNASIDLKPKSLRLMSKNVGESTEFAEELISYRALPKDIATSIYWHVSVALRDTIVRQFSVKELDLDAALEDCVQDFTDTSHHLRNNEPSDLMHEVAQRYKAQNKITDTFLIEVLRRRQGRFFVALFGAWSELEPSIIWGMMKQSGGQGLAVSCRALGITKDNFVSMLLLGRTIAAPQDTIAADELKMAMRYYDGLTHKMAKDILKKSIAQ